MSFLEYFNGNVTKVRIVHKRKSRFMRFLAACLWLTNKLKLSKIDDFYDYVTTIGHTIYAPDTWNMRMDVSSILLHELVHVMQFDGYPTFPIQYLFSSSRRAYYESVCLQAEMLYDSDNMLQATMQSKAAALTKYGCSYDNAIIEIRIRRAEIKENKAHYCADTVFKAYECWKNPWYATSDSKS